MASSYLNLFPSLWSEKIRVAPVVRWICSLFCLAQYLVSVSDQNKMSRKKDKNTANT